MNRDDIAALHDLTGRVAIVTGGSRGIGLAVAPAFAAQGANVVVSSRKADACEAAAAAIAADGGSALAVPAHMGDPDDIERLAATTAETFGGIDIVVNNAANPLAEPLGAITVGGFEKSFAVNVRGPVLLVQACLPWLDQSEHASVVNVISAGAFIPSPGTSLYGAGKTALLSFTRSMAAELVGRGIRVNALAPGTVDTTMVRNTGEAGVASMTKASRMGRLADPDEMVGAVLFMASDAGSYLTGQCVTVDGGMVPPR